MATSRTTCAAVSDENCDDMQWLTLDLRIARRRPPREVQKGAHMGTPSDLATRPEVTFARLIVMSSRAAKARLEPL